MYLLLSVADIEPKTLQQVAKSCENEEGPKSQTSSSPDKQQLSLAEAAKVYEDAAVPSKSKLEEVEVVTGEEEERNVLKVKICVVVYVNIKCVKSTHVGYMYVHSQLSHVVIQYGQRLLQK